MPLPNLSLNRMSRQALYSLKREYGGTIDIYQLTGSATDARTGAKTVTKSVLRVQRAIILPARKSRTADQSISQISANKSFVMGGTYDVNAREFIIDRQDTPALPDLTADDWIVFNNRKFQIQNVESFEFDTGWVITARELVGEIPEQIFLVRVDHLLSLTQSATTS